MVSRRILGVAVLCALAACQKAETPEQRAARISAASDSAKTAIEAQNARFGRYTAAGQGDSVALLYTEDAVAMPPNAAMVTGRAAIAAVMNGLGAMPLVLHADQVWSDGENALERGRWEVTMTPPGGTATTMKGKYLVHWKRVNGEWLLHQDIWNDDAPMVAAAPARRN